MGTSSRMHILVTSVGRVPSFVPMLYHANLVKICWLVCEKSYKFDTIANTDKQDLHPETVCSPPILLKNITSIFSKAIIICKSRLLVKSVYQKIIFLFLNQSICCE